MGEKRGEGQQGAKSVPQQPEKLREQRHVVLKLKDDVQMPYTDDLLQQAKRHGLAELARALEKSCSSCTIRRLFMSVEPTRLQELMARAEAIGTGGRTNLLTFYRITCGPGVEPESLARALSTVARVQAAYVEPRVVDTGTVNDDDDVYASLKDGDPPEKEGSWEYTDPQDGKTKQHQGYLDKAPWGVDARHAWNVPGGDGSVLVKTYGTGAGPTPGTGPATIQKAARLVAVQSSWNYRHQDLKQKRASLETPIPEEGKNGYDVDGNVANAHHGTAILGIVCGDDNDVGVVGVAPNTPGPRMSTYYDSDDNIPDAIFAAADVMQRGDVLLLPLGIEDKGHSKTVNGFTYTPVLPREAEYASFVAIQAATAKGIIVVEAAANGIQVYNAATNEPIRAPSVDKDDPNIGGVDLDQYTVDEGLGWPGPLQLFNQAVPSTPDSGAIMVGASFAKTPHYRADRKHVDAYGDPAQDFRWASTGSNFGSRVDCYAWGTKVVTATTAEVGAGSFAGTTPDDRYGNIAGSSAACAIVAGVALCLQGVAIQRGYPRLEPSQMRAMLSTFGTPQGDMEKVPGAIGVMPDLRTLIKKLAPPWHPGALVELSIDPMAVAMPVYFVKIHLPNPPPLRIMRDRVRRMLRAMGPAERNEVLGRAKTLREYANVVEEEIGKF